MKFLPNAVHPSSSCFPLHFVKSISLRRAMGCTVVHSSSVRRSSICQDSWERWTKSEHVGKTYLWRKFDSNFWVHLEKYSLGRTSHTVFPPTHQAWITKVWNQFPKIFAIMPHYWPLKKDQYLVRLGACSTSFSTSLSSWHYSWDQGPLPLGLSKFRDLPMYVVPLFSSRGGSLEVIDFLINFQFQLKSALIFGHPLHVPRFSDEAP